MKKYPSIGIKIQLLILIFSFLYITSSFAQTATVVIGTGTFSTFSAGPTPYGSQYYDDRTQMLYLASELQAMELTGGNISMVGFEVVSASTKNLYNFRVKIKHTTATTLSGFESMVSGSLFYYGYQSTVATTGWNNYYKNNQSFVWNGVDNIIVEVSFDTSTYGTSSSIKYTSTGNNLVWSRYSNLSGQAEDLTGGYGYTQRPNLKITGASVPPLPIVNFPADVTLIGSASPSLSNNFVHVMHPLTNQGDNGEMMESINYFDGLGRLMQSNIHKASGDETKDIITPVVYDVYGRQEKDYLPFAYSNNGVFHSDPTNITNYTGYYGSVEDDFVFSQKHIESSPLNRVIEQGAPGVTWQLNKTSDTDKTIKFDYGANITSEVQLWTVDSNGDLSSSGFYSENKLYKSITKDENWTTGTEHTTEEFKDLQGRVILKRTYGKSVVNGTEVSNAQHDTYYVYDDYGNLTFVIPPKAEGTTSSSLTTEVLTNLCYQYTYDNRNRLIEKQIPGKGKESIVYDIIDRPVLTQDALQSGSEWLFTKYDGLGRIIYTGKYFSTTATRISLQTIFDTKSGTDLYETKLTIPDTLGIYYSNSDFPNTSIEVLTVNYYDNYTFDKTTGGENPGTVSSVPVNTDVAKGLSTGSKIKVLDQSPEKWITTVTYYDKNALSIYSYNDNAYLDTQDIVENQLDFKGKVIKIETNHVKGINSPIETIENFEYDDMERLLTHKHLIVGKTQQTIASNTYDDLGKLVTKGVGNISSSSTRLQTVNYQYNIRGWLTKINDPSSLGLDLFGFKIGYDEGTDPLYNGNISLTQWKTANTDNSLKTYNYTYDELNRIKTATDNTGKFNIWDVRYDKNGNLTRLYRKGHKVVNPDINVTLDYGDMDKLSYTYYSNSNRLQKVLDDGEDNYGFKDGVNLTNEFTYDTNGNMLKDLNKGMTSDISYNYLNLPTQVTFSTGNIQYIYDATGIKLKKIVSTGATTEYAGNYVYENDVLKQFSTPEGYVEPSGNSYQYVYQYKDQIENVRLSYSDLDGNGSINPSTEVLQERNFYPFGLEHRGYNTNIIGVENNYKTYQGQEINKELGLNWLSYKYRNYDPAIGRFFNIDPLAEKYNYQSPYNFSENRVIDGIELEGLEHYNAGSTLMVRRQMELAGASKEELADYDRGVTRAGAMGVDVTPLVGDAKGFIEAFTGSDLMTGEKLGWGGRMLGLFMLSELRTVNKATDVLKVGKWAKVSESMSDAAASFQKQITGVDVSKSFKLNGVKFDGVTNSGTLLDAKSGMKSFVGKDGNFKKWFSGADKLVKQANSQLKAANGVSVQWHFENKSVLEATQKLFKKNDIQGIKLIHTPRQ